MFGENADQSRQKHSEKRAEKRVAIFAIVSAGVTLALCVAVIFACDVRGSDFQAGLAGSIAPEIESRDVDNHDLKLSGLRGSFVLVYFTPDSAEISQIGSSAPSAALHRLSEALDAKQVTVLETHASASEQPMDLMSVAVRSTESNGTPQLDVQPASRTLVDTDGEIARSFRVDAVALEPTLFVIDASGVIRYRGAFEQASEGDLLRQFAPAVSAKPLSAAANDEAAQQSAEWFGSDPNGDAIQVVDRID